MAEILAWDAHGALDRAVQVLKKGGLVAFPTETVYGLGADAFQPKAVARVFEAKARPFFDPLIVHLAGFEGLSQVARDPEGRATGLAKRFWPGPLSLVLPRAKGLPDLVTAGLDSVAVRVPAHEAARRLIRALGSPIAAPSANPFGYLSPTTAAHVAAQLGDKVDLILDGGPCTVGVESTILSLLDEVPVVLRPGGVAVEDLEEALGEPVETARKPGPSQAKMLAPGGLEQHYASATSLRLLKPRQKALPMKGQRTGLLAFREPLATKGFEKVEVLGTDLRQAAAGLFAALRRLDLAKLDLILAQSCPEKGLGLAIMDRLRRGAAGRA